MRRFKADPGETGAREGCDEICEGCWARLRTLGFFKYYCRRNYFRATCKKWKL